jgi:heme/flavin dehydrogenase (mycofactocin system)
MASTREWFESIEEAERRARRALPRSVFLAIKAGAEAGVTLSENVAAWQRIGLLPTVVDLPSQSQLAVELLGAPLALPVAISPTGVQAVHPEGEVAVARAARAAGVPMGLSSFASKPIEEVAATGVTLWYQIYWMGTRDDLDRWLARAEHAGARGLIVTLDWIFDHRRDWGSPHIPDRLHLRSILRFAPEIATRPGYVARYLAHGGPPDLGVPNLANARGEVPTFFGAYAAWMQTPPPTWSDLAWLRERWQGPLMFKGIARPDDARRARDLGVDAIGVSNHGGNNLDTTPATARLLPGIVDAVGKDVAVTVDGGIRRGSDVVKAIALGARAVLVGRPYLWGLAAAGERGVANVLEILRQGVAETLRGLGVASVEELSREHLVLPEGFERRAPASGEPAP